MCLPDDEKRDFFLSPLALHAEVKMCRHPDQ